MSSLPACHRPDGDARGGVTVGSTSAWSITAVLADGLTGVNRVVSMLRQRNYEVTSLHADLPYGDTGDGTDSVTVVVAGTEHDAALLTRRLLRLPCVLDVRAATAGIGALSA